MTTYANLAEVEEANRLSGHYWFSPDTMEFFKSRIETDLIDGQFFISSEKPPHGPRAYTIRAVREDATIATLGNFGEYATLEDALDVLESGR